MRIKIGSVVGTPHGRGVVKTKEQYKDCIRWGVELENNPFSWTPIMYFPKELTQPDKTNP